MRDLAIRTFLENVLLGLGFPAGTAQPLTAGRIRFVILVDERRSRGPVSCSFVEHRDVVLAQEWIVQRASEALRAGTSLDPMYIIDLHGLVVYRPAYNLRVGLGELDP